MRGWALVTVAVLCAATIAASDRRQAQQLQQAIERMESKGDYPAAVRLLEEVARGPDRSVAARALLHLGLCHEKLGQEEVRKVYRRLIRDFADQRDAVAEARARLSAIERLSGTGRGQEMVARRVWGAGADSMGSPSPDGRYLSFVDWETGDLALRDLSTGQNRRLTNNGTVTPWRGFAQHSVISPDGRQVAYAWADEKEVFELHVIGVDGSAPRLKCRKEQMEYVQPAAWSPDGRSILAWFRNKDRTHQIALVSAADCRVRVLKSLDWRFPMKMSFSPDGRYIAYDFPPSEDAPERDIYLLAADASREVRAVEHPADDRYPLWTPDGSRIIFVSDRTRTSGCWAVEVAEGRPKGPPHLLKPDIGQVVPLGFTAKGSYFYAVQTGTEDVYIASIDVATGAVLSPPSRAGGRFIGSHRWPEWSPDGKQLAYVSHAQVGGAGPRGASLRFQSLETGQERELYPAVRYLSRLRWSPDGRSLLANARDPTGRGGLYQIDIETGKASAVVYSAGGYPRQSAWTPDGKVVYKHAGAPILLRDPASGQETEIYRRGGNFALSPDGRWLAVSSRDESGKWAVLHIVSVDGGQSRELIRVPDPQAFVHALDWTRDGRHLIFARNRPASKNQADWWLVSAETGESRRLGLMTERPTELRVHPDGRRVAFDVGRETAEIWAIENLLFGTREK